jgi:hypothetical protein
MVLSKVELFLHKRCGTVTDGSIGGIPLQGLTEISGEAGEVHTHISILNSPA